MEKQILKEELGIANDVNTLVSVLRNQISNDFAKNKNDLHKFYPVGPKCPDNVFNNTIAIKFNQINIKVIYHVLVEPAPEQELSYTKNFKSSANNKIFELNLYLTSRNYKINWSKHSETLQHEVEHLYQLYKKGKELVPADKLKNYNKLIELTKLNDKNCRVIGYTYYYYTRVEKNAFINGLYRKVMDLYFPGIEFNALEEIKKTPVYKNIQTIKETIQNTQSLSTIAEYLKPFNKSLDSFLRVANTVVNEYTKAFGRLLYKINKDIETERNKWLIDYNSEI